MISVPSGVRVWLSVGRTDMRRGMNGLALQVQGLPLASTALSSAGTSPILPLMLIG
jgi:hypothetical protein